MSERELTLIKQQGQDLGGGVGTIRGETVRRLMQHIDEERERWEIAAGRTRIMHEQAHALCGLFWAIRLWLEWEDTLVCRDCGDHVEYVFHRGCG